MSSRLLKNIVVGGIVFGASGCAGLVYQNRGVSDAALFASSSANEKVTENSVSTKSGKACSRSILGWVTTGDASAGAAAEDGGITKIATVDNEYSSILGLFASYCVVVTGE